MKLTDKDWDDYTQRHPNQEEKPSICRWCNEESENDYCSKECQRDYEADMLD